MYVCVWFAAESVVQTKQTKQKCEFRKRRNALENGIKKVERSVSKEFPFWHNGIVCCSNMEKRNLKPFSIKLIPDSFRCFRRSYSLCVSYYPRFNIKFHSTYIVTECAHNINANRTPKTRVKKKRKNKTKLKTNHCALFEQNLYEHFWLRLTNEL